MQNIRKNDLARDIIEVDLGSQPLPNSKALGLIWEPERDKLRIKWEESARAEVTTRRSTCSKHASLFDPPRFGSSLSPKRKIALAKSCDFGWDEGLPHILRKWEAWVDTFENLSNVSLPRCCYLLEPNANGNNVIYQLHGFCDSSNSAMSAVIYLRRFVEGKAQVSFLMGNSRLVLSKQSNWVISRKELEAAKICSELMLLAIKALHHLPVTIYFWTDSQVVLK